MLRKQRSSQDAAELAFAQDRLDQLVKDLSAVMGQTRTLVVTQRNTILEQRMAIQDVKQRIESRTGRIGDQHKRLAKRPPPRRELDFMPAQGGDAQE